MKSYTDLPQSKKLAEFLPLESADMHYAKAYFEGKKSNWFIGLGKPIKSDDIIPCWSLAALLDVLPKTINFGYENDSIFVLKSLENNKYFADYYEISCVKDNPVDACYEMIIMLHELKML